MEDFRPIESLIGLQNIIDGTSFFGLPASAAFAVIGLVARGAHSGHGVSRK
jgi:hypothetical protein